MSTMNSETLSQNSVSYSEAGDRITPSSKSLNNFNNSTHQPVMYGTDSIFNTNHVEKELECQICLSSLESPVLLPCGSHSLCFGCITSLFNYQQKQKGGCRAIFCPSCGMQSGMIKVKKPEDLKVNKELERVQKAYEKERVLWVQEKVQLETQLNCLKNSSVEEKSHVKENDKKKASKKGLTTQEVRTFEAMFENFGSEKLKEANMLILESIKAKEKELATPAKRSTRNGKEKSVEKEDSAVTTPSQFGSNVKKSDGASQRGLWVYLGKMAKPKYDTGLKRENTVNVDNLEKREYPLRSLKRTRTNQI